MNAKLCHQSIVRAFLWSDPMAGFVDDQQISFENAMKKATKRATDVSLVHSH